MMKILLPTSLLLGFVLSIGANQMSEAAYTQPLLSPPSQGQLIHVRWKTTHDVNAPSLHSVKRAHTHHHRTPSHHARHHIERKHTHHHHGVRHHR